jgi:hypothetical protein
MLAAAAAALRRLEQREKAALAAVALDPLEEQQEMELQIRAVVEAVHIRPAPLTVPVVPVSSSLLILHNKYLKNS